MTRKARFDSQGVPFSPIDADAASEIDEVLSAVGLILAGRSSEIRFMEIALTVYRVCSFQKSKALVKQVVSSFSYSFGVYIDDTLPELDAVTDGAAARALAYVNDLSRLLPRYDHLSKSVAALLSPVESLSLGRTNVKQLLRNAFVTIMDRSSTYSSTVNSIALLVDDLLRTETISTIENNPAFRGALAAKQLLEFASPARLKGLTITLDGRINDFFKRFARDFQFVERPAEENQEPEAEQEGAVDFEPIAFGTETSILFAGESHRIEEDPAPSEADVAEERAIGRVCDFSREANRLTSLTFWLLRRLFGDAFASEVRDKAVCVIANPANPSFQFCLERTRPMVRRRRLDDLRLFLSSLGNFAPSLHLVLGELLAEIPEEKIEPETIDFYRAAANGYSDMTRPIEQALSKFVNGNKAVVFASLLKQIHKLALGGADISPLAPLLGLIDDKVEFGLQHTRQVTRRLTRRGCEQLANEHKLLNKLQGISDDFDLQSLRTILNESERSFELHLGPVFMINSALWPFKGQWPSPKALVVYSATISERYLRLFPTRRIRFPINYWIVKVRDQKRGIVCEGTGVQAEVLLYLNNHAMISRTALEPQISEQFLGAALVSLTRKSSALLVAQSEDVYVLNPNFRSTEKVIKLVPPASKGELENTKAIALQKANMIEACITRLMKESKILKIPDLDAAVKRALSDQCPISTDDVRKGVESLISRNFIEQTTNNRVRYVQ
jgi:hypothetical protein